MDLGFCIIRKQFFTWGPQRPKFWISAEDFGFWGFWILDFGDSGLWILDFGDFGFWILGILDFGFWGVWILDFGDFGFWLLGFWGFWILDFVHFGDFGFWILGILDFGFSGFWGFWIFGTLCSKSLCAKFGFWILGIWDFGFWILGILDGHLVTKFWMLHKKRRLCTPNRVGGFTHQFSYIQTSFHSSQTGGA